MALSTAKELREALLLLREDEKARQRIIDKQIRKRVGARRKAKNIVEDEEEDEQLFGPGTDKGEETASDEPKDNEPEEGGEEQSAEDSDASDAEGESEDSDASDTDGESDKDEALAGANELNNTPQEIPQSLKGNDFVDRINKIRAGASVKDSEVRDRIVDYINRLTPNERNSLFITLDSLARIVLGGVDAAEVITPSMTVQKSSSDKKEPEQKPSQQKKPTVSKQSSSVAGPVVVVSEGIRKRYTEAPFVLRSGRAVSYGHKSHIADMEKLLSHLLNFRQNQERGSASDAAISNAIQTVKNQLSVARRRSMDITQKPTIDIDVAGVPALVEGE